MPMHIHVPEQHEGVDWVSFPWTRTREEILKDNNHVWTTSR